MEITWLGHSCFRIKGREAVIITDPYDESLGYSLSTPRANILTISHHHPGHSYAAGVRGDPFIVDGPGEYEVQDVLITGISTFHDPERGKERGKNTVYLIEVDGIEVCHLGDLGHVPSAEQVEEMGRVDVLLVPVGGVSTIDAALAAETVRLLEPKLVIPMHFQTQALEKMRLDPLGNFLREMGAKDNPPLPKIVVSGSSLPQGTQAVVLDYHTQGSL